MNTEKKIKTPWWNGGIVFFARVSGWIIAPVMVAVLVGKFLDKKFSTDPWIFFISLFISFIISLVGLVRESTAYMKKISPIKKEEEK